jgi:pyridoxamine 5'-phosphate oxidase
VVWKGGFVNDKLPWAMFEWCDARRFNVGEWIVSDSLQNTRRDFVKGILLEEHLPGAPLELLLAWHQAAERAGLPDANAMNLATVDAEGFPVCRTVLLRDASAAGLCFFTNYNSDKGQDITRNPKASLHFFWPGLERQVRVRGVVVKLDAGASDAYFASRPRDSQIGAWASPQSQVIASRDVLEQTVAACAQQFSGQAVVPRPPHWGGYRLTPDRYEFWQGRASRLHDRLRAERQGSGDGAVWTWSRLAP